MQLYHKGAQNRILCIKPPTLCNLKALNPEPAKHTSCQVRAQLLNVQKIEAGLSGSLQFPP